MIDSHCHLAGEEFEWDLPDAIARAQAAGVTAALCILAAGDESEARRAGRVRELWPSVSFAVGIHPHQAGEWAGREVEGVETVRSGVARHAARAIGEIGLDYHYDFSPRDVQQAIFRAQIRLARALDRPVVIHTRDATADTFRLLRDEGGGDVRGVFHCFTGDTAMALEAVALGFYVSFAGIVTFPRASELREAARAVPADRLLAETDSPYLAPVPLRGKRNEPGFVPHVYARLAEVRGEPVAALEAGVARNFRRLFGAGVPARSPDSGGK